MIWPNKSPEPTPVGAGRSASRFTVFGPAWLSFFHQAASRMSDSRTKEMVLVFDLRRDNRLRKLRLSHLDDQWREYLRGERAASIMEGRITKLFFAPYEGDRFFQLDDGTQQRSWVRFGDQSWYAVGRYAKVESTVFHVPHPIGDMPVVTRIWIGDDVA